MNEQKIYELMNSNLGFYLATMDGDQPRVRGMMLFKADKDGIIFHTASTKDVYKQLQKNPKAELCAFKDGAWIRIACELVEDDRVEARKSMLDAYPNLRRMYDENDGNTQVFYMKNATATISPV